MPKLTAYDMTQKQDMERHAEDRFINMKQQRPHEEELRQQHELLKHQQHLYWQQQQQILYAQLHQQYQTESCNVTRVEYVTPSGTIVDVTSPTKNHVVINRNAVTFTAAHTPMEYQPYPVSDEGNGIEQNGKIEYSHSSSQYSSEQAKHSSHNTITMDPVTASSLNMTEQDIQILYQHLLSNDPKALANILNIANRISKHDMTPPHEQTIEQPSTSCQQPREPILKEKSEIKRSSVFTCLRKSQPIRTSGVVDFKSRSYAARCLPIALVRDVQKHPQCVTSTSYSMDEKANSLGIRWQQYLNQAIEQTQVDDNSDFLDATKSANAYLKQLHNEYLNQPIPKKIRINNHLQDISHSPTPTAHLNDSTQEKELQEQEIQFKFHNSKKARKAERQRQIEETIAYVRKPVQKLFVEETCARVRPYTGMRNGYRGNEFNFLMHGCRLEDTAPHVHLPKFPRSSTSLEERTSKSKMRDIEQRDKPLQFAKYQQGQHVALGIIRSSIHGVGVFALEFIPKGRVICEYVGEVISQPLADVREALYKKRGLGCYMFSLDQFNIVDATKNANFARFINHSCNPNCEATIITGHDKRKHIVIFAKRNIGEDEELSYDYKFDRNKEEQLPCRCSDERCRKRM